MKTLQEVVDKREGVRESIRKFEKMRNDIRKDREWYELNDEEKRENSKIVHQINMLRIQEDALTYVINYDSQLRDLSFIPIMMSSKSIDKS